MQNLICFFNGMHTAHKNGSKEMPGPKAWKAKAALPSGKAASIITDSLAFNDAAVAAMQFPCLALLRGSFRSEAPF